MRVTIVVICTILALIALTGRATITPAVAQTTISPMELMKTAYDLPVESFDAI